MSSQPVNCFWNYSAARVCQQEKRGHNNELSAALTLWDQDNLGEDDVAMGTVVVHLDHLNENICGLQRFSGPDLHLALQSHI